MRRARNSALAVALAAIAAGVAAAAPSSGAGGGEAAAVAPSGSARATAAAAPRAQVMVVGRSRVLRPARTVVVRATTVRAGGRRCALAAGTPLAALAALRGLSFHARDFGACSRRAGDSESLFVTRIGDERNRGVDGWVYKVGRRAPSISAGSPAVRVRRSGVRVLWFWCRQRAGGCQRTLELTAPARVAPGAPVAFAVRGYDDLGRGVPVAGATVSFAGGRAVTGADGRASLAAPPTAGRRRAAATAPPLAPAFPVEVTVG